MNERVPGANVIHCLARGTLPFLSGLRSPSNNNPKVVLHICVCVFCVLAILRTLQGAPDAGELVASCSCSVLINQHRGNTLRFVAASTPYLREQPVLGVKVAVLPLV